MNISVKLQFRRDLNVIKFNHCRGTHREPHLVHVFPYFNTFPPGFNNKGAHEAGIVLIHLGKDRHSTRISTVCDIRFGAV